MPDDVPSVVVRDDLRVRYVEVADTLSEIKVAWPTLEVLVGDLRGQRFVAAFDPMAGWYRACVEIRDDATLAHLDLPEAMVPGVGTCDVASAANHQPSTS